ncbi:hypothetical protein [Kouleothrix sp.]|uniref:hypothetical protein n=1 Tax=Kouleothrix sp. TaxID=2779161 RepID=UPI00391BAD1B
MRLLRTLACLALLASLLASCGSTTLLSNVGPATLELRPTGNGENVQISYTIGKPARVSVYLQDAAGTRYTLRDSEPRLASADAYTLFFDGTAPTGDPVLKRKALPSGSYTYTVQAQADDGEHAEAHGTLTIGGVDAKPPLIEDLVVFPETISPNADGIDDIAEITYQLPVSATVDITFTAPDGKSVYPFVAADKEGPTPQRQVWNGKTVDNALLPDGVYTYTIRAQDLFGNLVERQGKIAIAGGGQPEIKLSFTNIAPDAIMKGDVITVTMRVKNTGDVPIRTYGPPSGYEYSTDDVFSSVAGGKYVAKPGGFWRVGVDWDANSGGAAKRYPYRWAITPRPPEQWKIPNQEDVLLPGEEAEVIGRIRVQQPETKMSFYVGLIQDGVGFFQDRTGRTIVKVGF